MEDFADTYMNLTLKSLFMLKYIDAMTNIYKSSGVLTKENPAVHEKLEFILKSDDNCFINLRTLKSTVERWRSQKSKKHFLTGYKIDQRKEKIDLLRPTGVGTIQDDVAKRFEIPMWMHQGMLLIYLIRVYFIL